MNRASVLAALAVAVASPSLAWAQTVAPVEQATKSVVIRSMPTVRSTPLGGFDKGKTLKQLDEANGWRRVELPDGRIGYVSSEWTRLLDAGAAPSGTFKLHVIDVGTGLAVFVEGRDFSLLFDAGSQDDLGKGNENRVVAYIRTVRPDLTTLDHVILSHPHKDHLELMPEVFDKFAVKNVWNSGAVNKTAGYCRFLKKIAAETGVRYRDAIDGTAPYVVTFTGSSCSGPVQVQRFATMNASPVALGTGASMTMLYRDASKHDDPNENSIVTSLVLGNIRVLLAGDAEGGERRSPSEPPDAGSVEAKLLQCCKTDLKADILVVGHHGSRTSSRTAFLDAVGAKTFVISSGPFPYKSVVLPDADVVQELARRGTVYRTDVDDAGCAVKASKVGSDADENPGGCSNVLITVRPDGSNSAAYNPVTD
ncbi:MAG: MBL fold metallo-hydrolase [Alphaproteobacteria bacterium]|nr:MBL fold metallo-hydrolase [Alphaproteobacteria bacterium]